MTPSDVIPYMAMLAGIGIAIDSAEVIAARKALALDGLYSWRVLSLGRRYLAMGALSRPLGVLFQYPQVLALPLVQLIAAAILIPSPMLAGDLRQIVIPAAAISAGSARMLFYMRQQLGLDGADQMLTIALLSTGFGALLGNSIAASAAVDYAALQLLLSYAVAGVAKAVSVQWRSGQAIVGITSTIGYGQLQVQSLLSRRPLTAKAACWSVIVFECCAVPLALASTKGAWIVIIVGTFFHVGIALVMGLNVFLWAFGACYPALLLLSYQIHWLAVSHSYHMH